VVKAVVTGPRGPAFASAWATLDGTASEGRDLLFEWSVVSGNSADAELATDTGGVARFRARRAGLYVVRLTVVSADERDSAATLVTVSPLEPRVGGPTSVAAGDAVELDGARSTGPPDMALDWSAVGGRVVPAGGTKARFLAEAPGKARVTLAVRPAEMPDATAETVHEIEVYEARERGGSDDDAWWRDEQITRNRQALADVRAASAKWEASITGFLGVFAAVAFLAGPSALADVGSPGLARLGLTIIGIAFALAFVARVLVADVGNATPAFGRTPTIREYRERSWDAANIGAEKLNDARWLAIAAALLLAVASLATAFAAVGGPSSAPLALVRTPSGIICGELTTADSGVVSVGDVEVGPSRDLVFVDSCNIPSTADATTPSPPATWLLVSLAILGAVIGWRCAEKRWVWQLVLALAALVALGWVAYVAIDGQPFTTDLDVTWSIPASALSGAAVAGAVTILRGRPQVDRHS
jgi:hypothetical protein